MIARSDERVFVADSAIHGRGIFARERIRPNTLIGVFQGKRTRSNGHHVLWYPDDDGREVGIQVENQLRYINHSPTPNAAVFGTELFATRNIQPGAEITIHYGDDWAE